MKKELVGSGMGSKNKLATVDAWQQEGVMLGGLSRRLAHPSTFWSLDQWTTQVACTPTLHSLHQVLEICALDAVHTYIQSSSPNVCMCYTFSSPPIKKDDNQAERSTEKQSIKIAALLAPESKDVWSCH